MRIELPGDAEARRNRRRRRIGWGAAALAVGFVAMSVGPVRNRLVSVATGHRAPTLQIGIQFKDLHPIHQQRNAALRTGRLVVSDDDFAPATLEFGNQSVQARLRLAAAPVAALRGDQWPLRLRVGKGEHLFGQRSMLLAPVTAHSVVDALFLEHLGRLAGLSTRLLFVDAVLNGRRLGTMALSEIASTEMLERQQRRDGIVVRIGAGGRAVAVEPRRIEHSGQLRRDLLRAERLVAAAVGRTRPADQLFDVESLGRFLAVAEHWNRTTLLDWDQLCFYLNPMTSRLEPVGVASDLPSDLPSALPSSRPSTASEGVGPGPRSTAPLLQQALANPAIRAAYESTRRQIAAEFADGSAWERAAERERALRGLLDLPNPPVDSVASLRDRTTPDPPAAPEPRAIATAQSSDASDLDGFDPLPVRSVEEVIARHPFLLWDAGERTFRVPPGSWSVRGSIVLPDGAGLRLSGGTTLRFEPRAGLIARGPLLFEGAEDAPIVLEGPPGTKRSQLWSGVYVIESERDSLWKHVIVRNTGGFKRGSWSLRGGVVFRRTHVEFGHCSLRGSLADDVLNLVRATFRLRDVEVRDAASDAIDLDYSEGLIEGAAISRAVGDGFDLGGSRLEVRDARFNDIEDKAISVGERSELVAQSLEIDGVSIGIASKNSSRASVRDSTFRRVALVGLIAYRNQTVYEAGEIVSERNQFEQTARQALVESGSRIVIDGTDWPDADISVASVAAVAATE